VSVSLYIAKRYLFSKSSNNTINIITRIAGIGVIIGVLSLFVVLSGFSGLKDFSLQFTNLFDADLKVFPVKGKTLSFTPEVASKLNEIKEISAFSKIIEERTFLQFKGKNHIAYIKGVDNNYGKVVAIDSVIFHGRWFNPLLNEVVIGLETSSKLSLGIQDYSALLNLYVPKPGVGEITALNASKAFKQEKVVVSGVYQINEELDGKYIFADINFTRNLIGLDSSKISSIEIKLAPDSNEKQLRKKLQNIFPEEILIKNRLEQNDTLNKMLNTENLAVYLIFTLILIIALFNVIGSIIMMILDKQKNIKTLYNLGITLPEIRKIFFYQGVLMTLLGGFVGIFLGIILVYLQIKFSLVYITATLPYPVKLTFLNIIIVLATISLLGVLASKIASSRITKSFIEKT
jgi:lipoprotein-releasing system permease protein